MNQQKRDASPSIFTFHISWLLLPLFTVSNILLAYFPLSITVKLWIGFFGIAVPFGMALRFHPSRFTVDKPAYESDLFGPPSRWAILGAIAGLVFLRFLFVDKLYVWPNPDEGMSGILSWDLSRAFRWQFFWSFGEVPPLHFWIQAFCVRVFGLSLKTIWVVPAVLSCITVPLAYFAARSYFSRSFAWIFAALTAFSYWPLYEGRFSHQGVLLPPWVFSVFWAWNAYEKEKKFPLFKSVIFGVILGLGSFLFTPWPAFVFLIFGILAWQEWRRPEKRKSFLTILAATGITLLPFLYALLTEGWGHHVRNVSAFRGYFPLSRQILTDVSYFTSLFWGTLVGGSAYGSPWGGLMNPLLSAFLFMGLLECHWHFRRPWVRFALIAALITLLPGLLSMNVQMYRVIPVLPFLLFFTAFGVQAFALTLAKPTRLRWILLFLSVSAVWDATLLVRPALRPLTAQGGVFNGITPGKSLTGFRAFQALRSVAEKNGPGLIFTSFTPPHNDASLFVGTYPFNAAVNPDLATSRPSWAAFQVNIHYQPYLKNRFPNAKWIWLDADAGEDDGGWMLGILPLASFPPRDLLRFRKAHSFFLETDVALHNRPDGGPYWKALPPLAPAAVVAKGDPFLTALYWEKVACVRKLDVDYLENVDALRRAIREGLPADHLRFLLGAILSLAGDTPEARNLLTAAAKDPFNKTRAADVLKQMDERNK